MVKALNDPLLASEPIGRVGNNIQVNNIFPGWIDTDLTRKVYKQMGLYDRAAERTPRGVGCPEDLA
jgi:NAD(P)-dependent dehydrogenase (short-subunit alcohol dehydrogenase family)